MTHELMTLPENFRDVASGAKRFELRFNDRMYREGNVIMLREYDPARETYTGSYAEFMVTHVLYSHPRLEYGWCILSIELEKVTLADMHGQNVQ